MNRLVHSIGSALLGFAGAATATAVTQDLAAVQAEAVAFMHTQLADNPDELDVQAGTLDPRLQLAACDQALQAFLPRGARTLGNTTVGVRCTGSQPWTIYVSVRVSAFGEVLVANRSLTRGASVGPDDLRLERRDLATLPYGYMRDPQPVIGQRLTRSVNVGQALTPNFVTAPHMVTRGEQVTVLAQAGGMEVRMNGKALGNGAAGQRVQVRTLGAERVVEGTVVAPGIVEVNL